MKKILTSLLSLLICIPFFASASDEDDQFNLAKIQADRKLIVETVVQPSPQQSKAFWDAYWAYRETIANLNTRSIKLIKEYTDSYAALNDDQALRMLKEAAVIEVKRVEARKTVVKKLEKILVPKQLVRFLQIENKMNAVIGLDMAITIPFTQ